MRSKWKQKKNNNEVMAIWRCEINNGNDANSQENGIKELNKMKIVILMWKYIWFLINLRLFYATRARWYDFRSTIYCNISQLMRVHGFHKKNHIHTYTHTSSITGTILVMSIFSRWIQCWFFFFFCSSFSYFQSTLFRARSFLVSFWLFNTATPAVISKTLTIWK